MSWSANGTNGTNGTNPADHNYNSPFTSPPSSSRAEGEAVEQATATLIAKYGGEALAQLRRGAELLDFIAAIGKLHQHRWASEADAWRLTVNQVVAQIEDTDLTARDLGTPKQFAGVQTLKRCIREHRTIVLRTRKVDGTDREVEVEPYALRTLKGELTLLCYNMDHQHVERIPLHRILYSTGEGIHFLPRFPTFIEGEDDVGDVEEAVEQTADAVEAATYEYTDEGEGAEEVEEDSKDHDEHKEGEEP